MAKIVLLLLALAAFQNAETPNAGLVRIKTITDLKKNKITNYYYTKDGKITSISGKGGTVNFHYNGNAVIKQTITNDGRITNTDSMILDEHGHVILFLDPQYPTTYHRMEYSPNGFRLSYAIFSNAQIILKCSFQNNGGNERWSTTVDEKGKTSDATYSKFLTDKENTIGNEQMGQSFMGRSSQNLVSESKVVVSSKDTLTRIFNYHFDSKGRVINKVEYNGAGTLQDSLLYTYY